MWVYIASGLQDGDTELASGQCVVPLLCTGMSDPGARHSEHWMYYSCHYSGPFERRLNSLFGSCLQKHFSMR